MYASSLLSLGNINKLAGGMSKRKKGAKKGGQPIAEMSSETSSGGAPPGEPIIRFTPNLPSIPEGLAVQQPVGAPAAQAGNEQSFFSKIMNAITSYFAEYKNQNKLIKEQTSTLHFILFAVIVSGALLAFINTVINLVTRVKTDKLISENRYNKDLLEYNMAKNTAKVIDIFKNLRILPFTLLACIPFLLILLLLVIAIRFTSKDPLNTIDQISLFIYKILLFASILILIYVSYYIDTFYKLKQVRTRIDNFENFVYSKFYKDASFLKILYNNGVATDNPNAIIRNAIKNTLQGKDARDLNINTITKIAYTLNIYYFLNKDLVENENMKRNYKTECLEVFNPVLIMLPGKSRIFRIGDYMRSNIHANMDDTTSISNILHAMNATLKLDMDTVTRIKLQVRQYMHQTRALAFQIRAYKLSDQIMFFEILTVMLFPLLPVFMFIFNII